jgi:hypothetical protein
MSNTLQLHVRVPPYAEPAQIDDTELELQVVWVTPAGDGVRYHSRTSGVLRIPALLLRQLQQATPIVASLIPDEVAIVWTGVPLEPLPPDPMLGRLAKLLRGVKRLWGER